MNKGLSFFKMLFLFFLMLIYKSTLLANNQSNQCISLFSVQNTIQFKPLLNDNSNFNSTEIGKSVWKIISPTVDTSGNTIHFAGTLFFVSNQGHFITNRHVFDRKLQALEEKGLIKLSDGYLHDNGAIIIQLPSPITIRNDVLRLEKQFNTVSLLLFPPKVGESPHGDYILGKFNWETNYSIPIEFTKTKKGDPISAIGYPEKDSRYGNYITGADGSIKISKGVINNWIAPQLFASKDAFLSNIPITGGSSGSPVFNSSGQLIGIVAGYGNHQSLSDQTTTVIVSLNPIIKAIQEVKTLESILLTEKSEPPSNSDVVGGNISIKNRDNEQTQNDVKVETRSNGNQSKTPAADWVKSDRAFLDLGISKNVFSNNPYEVLQISNTNLKNETDAQIKNQWKKLIAKHHTDKAEAIYNELNQKLNFSENEKPQIIEFIKEALHTASVNINSAYQKVKDEASREKYERTASYNSKSGNDQSPPYSNNGPMSYSRTAFTDTLQRLPLEQRMNYYRTQLFSLESVISVVNKLANENFSNMNNISPLIFEVINNATGTGQTSASSIIFMAFQRSVIWSGVGSSTSSAIGLVKVISMIKSRESYLHLQEMAIKLSFRSVQFKEFKTAAELAHALLKEMETQYPDFSKGSDKLRKLYIFAKSLFNQATTGNP